MTSVVVALILLGIGEMGCGAALFWLMRNRGEDWETVVVGEIVAVQISRDRDGTQGTISYRDLGYRMTKISTKSFRPETF